MQNQVYTTIAVNARHAQIVDLWNESCGYEISQTIVGDVVVVYADNAAPNGNVDWLEDLLNAHAISYDKEWHGYPDFPGGKERYRVVRDDTGQLQLNCTKWYNNEESIRITELALLLLAHNSEKLEEFVKRQQTRFNVKPSLDAVKFEPEHQSLLAELQSEQLYRRIRQNDPITQVAIMIMADTLSATVSHVRDRQIKDDAISHLAHLADQLGIAEFEKALRDRVEYLFRAYNETVFKADGSWDRSYQEDWLPMFALKALSIDKDRGQLRMSADYLEIARELGRAHAEMRAPRSGSEPG